MLLWRHGAVTYLLYTYLCVYAYCHVHYSMYIHTYTLYNFCHVTIVCAYTYLYTIYTYYHVHYSIYLYISMYNISLGLHAVSVYI